MTNQPISNDDVMAAVDALRSVHGLDFARTRHLLRQLTDGRWHTVSEAVSGTGATRRWVEETLAAMSRWTERDGDRWRIADASARQLREAIEGGLSLPPGFDRPDLSRAPWADVLHQMRDAAAGLPPPVAALDHVPATSETAVRRAYALVANYDLAGRQVLCLGDHDLTSVALALVEPTVQVSVVDIDERILGYLGDLAARLKLPVRTYFCDLRTELAPSLRDAVDLVFTDPPYTPAGIELFLTRAITALRRQRGSRVLFCYSHNERQLARGLEVQNVVSGLQLTLDAMLPEFNEFTGAESIGSRSSLWICQPMTKAWAAADRRSGGVAIYTRGRQAEETEGRPDAGAAVRAALRAAAGEGAVQEVSTSADASLNLETLLRTEPPAGQGGMVRPGSTVLADVTDVHPSYAYRLLLRTLPAERVLLAVSREFPELGLTRLDSPVWRMLGARYRIRAQRGNPHFVVVEALRRPVDDLPEHLRVARYVLDHPKARLLGAWREALVGDARRRGTVLSKNEARALIAESINTTLIEGRYLAELPHTVVDRVASAMLGLPTD
jgi:hypothetical protein